MEDTDQLDRIDKIEDARSSRSPESVPGDAPRQSTPEVFAFNAQFTPRGPEGSGRVKSSKDSKSVKNTSAGENPADDEESLSFGGGEAPRARAGSNFVKISQNSSTRATTQQKSSKVDERSPLVSKVRGAAQKLASPKRPEIVSPLSALSKSQLVQKLAEASAADKASAPGGVLLAPGVLDLSGDVAPQNA